jgi:hypothetical protein
MRGREEERKSIRTVRWSMRFTVPKQRLGNGCRTREQKINPEYVPKSSFSLLDDVLCPHVRSACQTGAVATRAKQKQTNKQTRNTRALNTECVCKDICICVCICMYVYGDRENRHWRRGRGQTEVGAQAQSSRSLRRTMRRQRKEAITEE